LEGEAVTDKSEEQSEVKWFKRFLAMFFAGFLMTLLGVVFLVVAALLSGIGSTSIGGIVWVFPFLPIVFGAGPEAYWLILVAVLLALLGVLMLFVLWRTSRKGCF
jgi:uncharacterized membrane protein